MKEIYRELLGDCAVITFGILSTFIFSMILFKGVIFLFENCKPILYLELALAIGAIPLGIHLFRKDIKGFRK